MTEKIQQAIQNIRLKAHRINNELVVSKEKVNALESENKFIKAELGALQEENAILRTKLSDMEIQWNAAKEQVVNTSVIYARKEEEIDELVKEIEYCISQLKK
jgi:chromosome segregation ATPase